MDHDRRVVGIIQALVLEPEAEGKLEVELDRGALVLALERIGDFDVDLGAIECAIALVDAPRVPEQRQRLLERVLGLCVRV